MKYIEEYDIDGIAELFCSKFFEIKDINIKLVYKRGELNHIRYFIYLDDRESLEFSLSNVISENDEGKIRKAMCMLQERIEAKRVKVDFKMKFQ